MHSRSFVWGLCRFLLRGTTSRRLNVAEQWASHYICNILFFSWCILSLVCLQYITIIIWRRVHTIFDEHVWRAHCYAEVAANTLSSVHNQNAIVTERCIYIFFPACARKQLRGEALCRGQFMREGQLMHMIIPGDRTWFIGQRLMSCSIAIFFAVFFVGIYADNSHCSCTKHTMRL